MNEHIKYEELIAGLEEQVFNLDESLQLMHKRLAEANNRIEELLQVIKEQQ